MLNVAGCLPGWDECSSVAYMVEDYPAAVAAGSLRDLVRADAVFHSTRASDQVAVDVAFTGGHMLHLAIAACVLNDIYREAAPRGLRIDGVRVRASGGFDPTTAASTGISYTVDIDSPADAREIGQLLQWVDEIAEIPRAVRASVEVKRSS